MVRKIVFRAQDQNMAGFLVTPVPAISMLPNWYKEMDTFTGPDKHLVVKDHSRNMTLKRCLPLRDSLGLGYFILSFTDLYVRKTELGVQIFEWVGEFAAVGHHSLEQVEGYPVPKGYSPQPHKYMNWWNIETPKGYSILITQPMHMNDSTLSIIPAVIDSDKYGHTSVHFPLFVKENFEGVIPKGTPIAQIIPFKREPWKAQFEPPKDHPDRKKIQTEFMGFYAKNYWSRKEFK